MDSAPSSNETTGLSLPPPVEAEQLPMSDGATEAGPAAAEQAVASPEVAAARGQTAAAAAPAVPLPLPTPQPAGSIPQDDSTPLSQATLSALDDPDLIEKEWVNKAKQIVERTRNDPHQQSEELTLVKADYIKQRYGKTIKLSK